MLVTGGSTRGLHRPARQRPRHGRRPACCTPTRSAPGGIAQASAWPRASRRRAARRVLGDNIFERLAAGDRRRLRGARRGARVLLARIDDPSTCVLGVAELGRRPRSRGIVEKPDEPPSALARHRRLLLRRPGVRDSSTLEPSGRGELEITDVNSGYAERARWSTTSSRAAGTTAASRSTPTAVNDFVRADRREHA